MDPKDEYPVKKIRLKYQSSPINTTKVPALTYTEKGRKLLFHDDIVWQPLDKMSQDNIAVAHGGETLDLLFGTGMFFWFCWRKL